MGNNQSWALSEFSNSEKTAFRRAFDQQNQRFGWSDNKNYLLIERHVIFSGAKDWVIAKYDNFVQYSILAKNEQNASMPNFIHDHYVDYLMSQITSSIDQLSYPQIKYKEEEIPLIKNSEDGLRKWLLIGNLKGKLCVEYNSDIYVRFSFKVVVYSTAIEDDEDLKINNEPRNNNNDNDSDDADDTDEVLKAFGASKLKEGNLYDTNLDANKRLSVLGGLFKKNEKNQQQKLKEAKEKKQRERKMKREKQKREKEQEIAKRRRQKMQNKQAQQQIQNKEQKRRMKAEIEQEQKELEILIKLEQQFKDDDDEKADELKTDQTFEVGHIIEFNSEPDDSDTETHTHQGKILAIKQNQWTVQIDNGRQKRYMLDKIKIINKNIDSATAKLCAEQGWKKCPNVDCGVYIERAYGCKHMKCPNCATEFCDVCAKQIDPLNWKKHFLPPNTCRLWDDLDDLLENDDEKMDDEVAQPDNGVQNNINFEVFEEGDIYHNNTDQNLALFDENIIQQLVKIGLADRNKIIFAMKHVENKNDINEIADFLMQQNVEMKTNAAHSIQTNDNKLDNIQKSINSLQSDDDKVQQQIQELKNQLNALQAQKQNNDNQEKFSEDIIQELIACGLGDRNKIISAMRMVDNKDDVNLIANYLMMTTNEIDQANETALHK